MFLDKDKHLTYEFGPFRLHSRPLELFCGDQYISLARQPLNLLALLVRKSGQIVTHDEIQKKLWADRTVEFQSGIHSCIKQIRLALKDSANNPSFISTIPRQGYRFLPKVKTRQSTKNKVSIKLPQHMAASVFIGVVILSTITWLNSNGLKKISGDALSNKRAGLEQPIGGADFHEVQNAFTKGQYFLNLGDSNSLAKGIKYFEKALALAPEFQPALIGLSDAHAYSGNYTAAKAYIQRAEKLNDSNTQIHIRLGYLYLFLEREWASAKVHFEKALKLNPQAARAYHGLAAYEAAQGNLDQSIAHMRKALILEPTSALLSVELGWMLYFAGEYESAEKVCQEALTLNPEQADARQCLIQVFNIIGKYEAAGKEAKAMMDKFGANDSDLKKLKDLKGSKKVQKYNQWWAGFLSQNSITSKDTLYAIASAQAAAGSCDSAIRWLSQAITEKAAPTIYTNIDPAFAQCRDRNDFTGLVKQLNLKSQ